MTAHSPLEPRIKEINSKWSLAQFNSDGVAITGDNKLQLWTIAELITGNDKALPQQVVEGINWGYKLQVMKPGYWKNRRLVGEHLFSIANRLVVRKAQKQVSSDLCSLAVCIFYLSNLNWYLFNSGKVEAYLVRDGQVTKITANQNKKNHKLAVIGIPKYKFQPDPRFNSFKHNDVYVLQSSNFSNDLKPSAIKEFASLTSLNQDEFDLKHQELLMHLVDIKTHKIPSFSLVISVKKDSLL